eukprot:388193_1
MAYKSNSINQIEYNLMRDSNISVIELSQYFSWINPFISFLPMCTNKLSSKSKHWSRCVCFCVILTVVAILFRLTIKVLWNIQLSSNTAYKTVYIIYEIIITVARLFSIYYFYFIFEHNSWMLLINKCAKYDDCCIHKKIKKYNRFLKICLLFMFVMGTGTVLTREIQYKPVSTKMYYIWTFIIDPICLICVYWPMNVLTIIVSIIFIKYHCHLLYLINALQIDSKNEYEIDFKYMFEIYEEVYLKFKCEYHKSLEYSILLYLGNIILDIWI